ncbi:MAG: phenylacetate--CoA ligase [Planctomycetota bacterium]|jgi:phenylacetate-CoA ligase|nr:phenylacetate--CoA ligase [Planctomycetota bacterium]
MANTEKSFKKHYLPASAADYVPRHFLESVQLQRLQDVVQHAYHNQAGGLYRQRMDEAKVRPDAIRSLNDIQQFPFMTKDDLRASYPYGLFAVPQQEVVRIHASSGTTGKPIVAGYTQADLDVWADSMARCMGAASLSSHDVIQVSYGYGLFTGGLGAHCGAEKIGAMVVPTSAGNTERQIMLMQDLGVTAICCTPSYFLHLAEKAGEMGVQLKNLKIRAGIFGAEPWSEAMRERIQNETWIKAHDIYGLTEIIGPGVAIECAEQNGLHILEDYYYPEIIDPETLQPLPDGEEGELVITTLAKRAMPMIRYRTRDITSIMADQCYCGRTIRRIRRIGRRSDDMLIIRGVNVYPSQIEAALLKIDGLLPHYQIVITRESGLDNMEIKVELAPELFGDRIQELESLQKRIAHAVNTTLNISAKITFAEPKSIARSEGKAKRVIDKRG